MIAAVAPRPPAQPAPRTSAPQAIDGLAGLPALDASRQWVVRAFVVESQSAEGRALKVEALKHLLAVQPALDASTISAIAAFVNESNSLDGRRLKLDALQRLFIAQPALDGARIRAIATFVNESNSLDGRRLKLDALPRILASRPTLDAPALTAMASFVNESNSLDGRRLKLDALAELAKMRPLTADMVKALAGSVNAVTEIDNRRAVISAALQYIKGMSGLSDDQVIRSTRFMGSSTNATTRAQKQELFDRLLAVGASSALFDAAQAFVDESSSDLGRQMKLRSLLGLLMLNQSLSVVQVQALASFVNASQDIPGRAQKLNAVSAMAQRRPDLPVELIRGTALYVKGLPAGAPLQSRLDHVIGFVEAFPKLDGGRVDLAVKTAVASGYGAVNVEGRFKYEVPMLHARALLGPAATRTPHAAMSDASMPSLDAASGMKLLREMESDVAVKATGAALGTATAMSAFFAARLDGGREVLFNKEPELRRATENTCTSTRSRVSVFASVAVSVGGLLGTLGSAFHPAVGVAIAAAAWTVLPRVVHAAFASSVNRDTEARMRSVLEPYRRDWQSRIDDARALNQAARDAVLARVAPPVGISGIQEVSTSAAPQALRVEQQGDSVVIGGIRVERRV